MSDKKQQPNRRIFLKTSRKNIVKEKPVEERLEVLADKVEELAETEQVQDKRTENVEERVDALENKPINPIIKMIDRITKI